jgi:sialate O-acetylesterase
VKRPSNQFSAILLLTVLIPASCFAELTLNPLFSDHGVLQQNQDVPVWGTADADAQITVVFGRQKKTATADKTGKWMVKLDAVTASTKPANLTITSGDESITVTDLLVGEVWVCSGQSNMAMSTGGTTDFDKCQADVAAGALKNLRLFKVPVAGADERAATVRAQWATVDARTAGSFSAVGFYFGRALLRDLKVPIGLIQSANGGTNAYSWINSDTVKKDPVAQTVRDYWVETLKSAPQRLANYEKNKAAWQEQAKAARAAGKKFAKRAPREPLHAKHVKRPAGHYNAMIAPLQPYAICGAIWYQGEANSRPPFCTQYKDLMFALVEDWRADWSTVASAPRRDFPIYLVQLPNYANGHAQGWPVIREQMLRFWQDGKNTGMVTTIDVGDPKDIHPKNKMPVGERLARFARANAYESDIVYSGPVYDLMNVDGNKVSLSFNHTGGGLTSLDGEDLRYFQVAGADGEFVAAEATICGKKITVSSPAVSEPCAVRYAWSNNPENPNFGNGEGLLASPFRTDAWKIDLE